MFCPNCGKQIPDGSKFCPYCGASLEGKGATVLKSKSSRSIAKIVIPIIIIVVILVGGFGLLKLIKHHQSSAIWPMFRYNAQHTGRCPYDTSKSNGTLKWKFETSAEIDSSPAIASDGTIYVGSYDGYLYAINPDGTLKWRYQTGFWISSSPVIASDGTVYIGSRNYYLYAIGSK